MKLRKGDQIKIIFGNDKGKKGKVIAVFPKSERIMVEGINLKKKHARPKKQGQKGEIIKVPAAFSVSRAMLVCPKCVKAARVGYKQDATGLKIRLCKKCGSEI